jgi:hypothetical protein
MPGSRRAFLWHFAYGGMVTNFAAKGEMVSGHFPDKRNSQHVVPANGSGFAGPMTGSGRDP